MDTMAGLEEADVNPAEDFGEAAARLRASRAGKASHLTRRMNIVNNLMNDPEYLEEVKGNMIKFNELLEDFKALHVSYSRMLDEDTQKEDNEKWYQPRCVQIVTFLATVTKWISDMEHHSTLTSFPPPEESASIRDPPPEEYTLAGDRLHEEREYTKAIVDMDYADVCTIRSIKSIKSSASTSSYSSSKSLRISAEAERAALMAKAAKLQEKHAIEEQEQMLKKRRETLELQTEIAAATAKVNYLKEAKTDTLFPDAAGAGAATA